LLYKEKEMAMKKQIETAWEEAQKVRGRNPNLWRRDPYGNLMYKPAYGRMGEYGWELDHKHPRSKGGSDRSHNLQALNTRANREKGAQYPHKHRRKR
jgi:5-methylcytosine-specific restriction endonuclease McrA